MNLIVLHGPSSLTIMNQRPTATVHFFEVDCLLAELINISNPKCKILGTTG